jgi:hypothetical protein
LIAGTLAILASCSSYHARSVRPTPFQRAITLERRGSVFNDFSFRFPASWDVQSHRSGRVAVLLPPGGPGRLRLMAFVDPDGPQTLTRDYAKRVATKALRSVGLQANIGTVRSIDPGHMLVKSIGAAAGTTYTEFVHVFSTGQALAGFFRAPSDDPHVATASRIMKSAALAAGT